MLLLMLLVVVVARSGKMRKRINEWKEKYLD
jgi:hypothetical protein